MLLIYNKYIIGQYGQHLQLLTSTWYSLYTVYHLHRFSIYMVFALKIKLFSIYTVYHLHGIHSTWFSISSKYHKMTILCLNLHGIHSTWFSLYTVFNLYLFSSTQYSLYTVYHLHCIQSTLSTIYIGFESTTLISISIMYFNLQLWFQSQQFFWGTSDLYRPDNFL